MLQCEIGLYYDFDVGQDGIPTGCPGFAEMNEEHWGRRPDGGIQNYYYSWSNFGGQRASPGCPFQKHADEGESPLHEIVDEFADSTASWLEVFVPTLEKMLENGYAPDQLQQSPSEAMHGFSCTFPAQLDWDRFWDCTKAAGT